VRAKRARFGEAPVVEPRPVPERPVRRRDRTQGLKVLGYGVLALGCAAFLGLLSGLTLESIGPAWAAHEGHGLRGTFVATAEHCDKSCSWTGNFLPDAALNVRPDVGITEADGITGVGSRVRAIDSGETGTVYPLGGGDEWLLCTGGAVLCSVGILGWLAGFVVRPIRRLHLVGRFRIALALHSTRELPSELPSEGRA
jgi:hypothetical protein